MSDATKLDSHAHGPTVAQSRLTEEVGGATPAVQHRRRNHRATLVGALALPGLGLLLAAVFLGLWPISYDLTQGTDFSYEYLVEYQPVWDWFRPILERFETLFPGAASSLEQLTTMLSIFWIASFLVYFAAFSLLRVLPQSRWAVALVVAFSLAFQVIFFLMPGTFTTDLFSYVMYGYIPRVYELNPYIYVPGYFPGNRMTSWIHPIWYYTPSIYGPLWIDFSAWLTGFIKDASLVDQALAYRAVSNVAHLLNLGLIGLLLRKLAPPRPVALLLLFAWNPLLLFEFAASGHNDSAMMLFVLLACLLFVYRRRLASVVALSAAAMVKIAPVLVLPLLLVQWAGRQRTRPAQLRTLALGGFAFVLVAAALYKPWYSGPDTFQLFAYWSKGPMYLNYVPDLIAQTIADEVLDPARLDSQAALESARTWVKWVTRLLFIGYFVWELAGLRRTVVSEKARSLGSGPVSVAPLRTGSSAISGQALLAAMGRVFLVFMLLVNTWVLAWYITWPFVLSLPLGWERLQTRVATGFTLSAPLMMYTHHYWSIHMTPWLYLVYLSPLLLLAPAARGLGAGRWGLSMRRPGAAGTRRRGEVDIPASPPPRVPASHP